MQELDFSLLDSIVSDQEQRKPTPEELEGPTRVKIERQQNLLAEASRSWKEWAAAIKKSERFRAEIAKGVNTGASDRALFLLAIECIYSLTGDKAFYMQIKKKFRSRKE